MKIVDFCAETLDGLTIQARNSARRRQHLNVHADYADPVQRLFNAIEPDSYIRPHRHRLAPRDEMMIAVRGHLALVIFDDVGNIIARYPFAANQNGKAAGVEVPAGYWHTVVALEAGSIILEIKAGPFDPSAPKEMAPWAPEEGSDGDHEYLGWLIG